MKKVFISAQQHDSMTDDDFRQLQEDLCTAVANSLNEEIEHIESCLDENLCPLERLAEDLKRMTTADCVVFFDWDESRICRLERLCAQEYGLEIYDIKKKKGN